MDDKKDVQNVYIQAETPRASIVDSQDAKTEKKKK